MRVIEVDEARFQCAHERARRLERAGRVDMNREIFAARIPGERQRVTGHRAGELDGIAMWPVERAGDSCLLLLEDELESDVLDRQRPRACDCLLLRVDRAGANRGTGDNQQREYDPLHVALLRSRWLISPVTA